MKIIDLKFLLSESRLHHKEDIYIDEAFKRTVLGVDIEGLNVEIVTDLTGCTNLHYISIKCQKSKKISLVIRDINNFICSPYSGISLQLRSKCFYWLPKPPVMRQWDDMDRIEREQDMVFDYRIDNGDLFIDVDSEKEGNVEFPVVVTRYRDFIDEIRNLSGSEKREHMKVTWFSYKRPSDCWNYIIKGSIYDPRDIPLGKRWKCEQCAHTLYNLVDYLEKQTNKKIYKELQEVIAYSVLLSLNLEGRWLHGHWTDTMETHTRFQINGIHLLLNHYEKTKREIFLKKARLAMDYLFSIADRFSSGSLWFLHDDLETSREKAELHYKSMKISRAFGKSETNTLCLNTHIYTLTALHRLHCFQKDEKLNEHFQRGLTAAKIVLDAKPATALYFLIYSMVDFFGRLQIIKLIPKKGEKFLRWFLWKPILLRIKVLFPRLSMPNGFIERDLCASSLSDFYHIQNLKDLLILYQQRKEDWIMRLIHKGVKYCLTTNIVERLVAEGEKGVTLMVDVLMMYCAITSKIDLETLVKMLLFLNDKGYSLSTDMFTSSLVTPARYSIDIDVDNPSIIPVNISKRDTKSKKLLLINPLKSKELLKILIRNVCNKEEIRVTYSDGKSLLMEDPYVHLEARGWLLLEIGR